MFDLIGYSTRFPGDGVTVPYRIVLCQREQGHYCTHFYNEQDNALAYGHYGMTLTEALGDFIARIQRTQDMAERLRVEAISFEGVDW
ncbi:MAG: hypothetical protein ABEL51_15720, partial [Salinibacter sp.]